jgi:hypothetical protein
MLTHLAMMFAISYRQEALLEPQQQRKETSGYLIDITDGATF